MKILLSSSHVSTLQKALDKIGPRVCCECVKPTPESTSEVNH